MRRIEKYNFNDVLLRSNKILDNAINITENPIKGAHDADFVIADNKAFIVYEANDIQAGENSRWHYQYVIMAVVDINTRQILCTYRFAESEMKYRNEKLPVGACFVPRIIQKDSETLRCFFVSENPGNRESQTWYIDFKLKNLAFDDCIFKAKLRTKLGLFDMQPQHFYAQALTDGLNRPPADYALFIIDSFKEIDHQTYVVLNNYAVGQNALAILNEEKSVFDVIGNFVKPDTAKLSEAAVNRLPNGMWFAISRRDDGDKNYMFSQSEDGRDWSVHEHYDFVSNGLNSKPTFDCFHGTYYLGWQENTKIDGVSRSVFNVDVSSNGEEWQRKYRFETAKSFQYPTFRQYKNYIYFTVTQGDYSESRKERIVFGKLE